MLNHIAVKSILGHGSSYEVDQAEEIIPVLKSDDLLIYDRGYASYSFMATLIKHNRNFVIRFPRSSFKEVQRMFDDDAPSNMVVTIKVPERQKKKVKDGGLSETIKIKLVRIKL